MFVQCTQFTLFGIENSNSLFNSFPNEKFLDSSKLKLFADVNFESDENSNNVYKWVENTAEKGEIARYEQFLRLL